MPLELALQTIALAGTLLPGETTISRSTVEPMGAGWAVSKNIPPRLIVPRRDTPWGAPVRQATVSSLGALTRECLRCWALLLHLPLAATQVRKSREVTKGDQVTADRGV
jgi:hypothetical protein